MFKSFVNFASPVKSGGSVFGDSHDAALLSTRGSEYRLDDVVITSATTQVAFEPEPNLFFSWLRVFV
jgi:hypothetical protein